ncbi:saccharopine dehydrogenase family protein [Isoptericola sp. NPDC060257]|uniref:saccharopine dehydrogenase family protein n=1 Tax=Isoptericola sp. NPDC060257 TaxID=3347087 RepID=UPI00365E8758
MRTPQAVMVYGAGGHTGGFVVDELVRRGLTPVLAGRGAERLAGVASRHPRLEVRVVGVDDAARSRAALDGVAVVVNCAGPFLDTAVPLASAAVAAGAHYLDVTAEQPAVQHLYERLDAPARAAGVAVVPAMAFYGGLADLLVTAVLDGERGADSVEVAVGLDHWWPTAGTRVTGERNTATRLVVRGGRLVPLADPAPTGRWAFPAPLGEQPVVELPFSEVVTVTRHLAVGELTSYLSSAPLAELRDDRTPPPPGDGARSPQRFVVDVAVRRGGTTHRTAVAGQDIYAVSAPILAEGVVRLLDGRVRGAGALAPAEAFDAADVLADLEAHPAGLTTARPEAQPAALAADPLPGR